MAIEDFDEYIRQGEPSQQERSKAWQMAIGLQKVDGLNTSDYLKETAIQHIEGNITIGEAKKRIDSYYQSKAVRIDLEEDRTEEADKVSARITELWGEQTFTLAPTELIRIHRHLFTGIYKFAGTIRDYNITKNEWILGGKTVLYASAGVISETLDYDINQERGFTYDGLSADMALKHIGKFVADLWQIHAFGEGNTRTIAVFLLKYLRRFGFEVNNDAFSKHSWFFRNALVRANYNDLQNGVFATYEPVERFLRHLLFNEEVDLRNRTLHISWKYQDNQLKVQNEPINNQLKVQNEPIKQEKRIGLNLQETVILQIISQDTSVTIDDIALKMQKSKSTIKRIIDTLKSKNILQRAGARKNGQWIILEQINEQY